MFASPVFTWNTWSIQDTDFSFLIFASVAFRSVGSVAFTPGVWQCYQITVVYGYLIISYQYYINVISTSYLLRIYIWFIRT